MNEVIARSDAFGKVSEVVLSQERGGWSVSCSVAGEVVRVSFAPDLSFLQAGEYAINLLSWIIRERVGL